MRITKRSAGILALLLVLAIIGLAAYALPRQRAVGAWRMTGSAQGFVIYASQKNGWDYQLRVFRGTNALVYQSVFAVSLFGFHLRLYHLPPMIA